MNSRKKSANVDVSTKDQIIAEAGKLFYKKGFESTTFADIAKAVGIAQPSIYAHFKNKMDLQKAVCLNSIDITRQYIDRQMRPADGSLDRLRSYLFANLDFFKNEKLHAHANMAFYFFSFSTDEMIEVFRDSQKKAVERLEVALFQAGHERILDLKEVPTVARSLHSLLIGDCYKSIYATSAKEHAEIKERHWQSALVLIKG